MNKEQTRTNWSQLGTTESLRERADRELHECMERFGESWHDMKRVAVDSSNDPQVIKAAIWTDSRVYAFIEESGCISLPLYPQGSLIERTAVD